MAENRPSKVIQRIFWALFIVCFAYTAVVCFLGGANVLLTLAVLAVIVALVWLATNARIPEKPLWLVFGLGLAATLVVQVWWAVNHYIVPYGFDMNAIYGAVKEIAENGHMVESDWYFVGQPFQSFILVELFVFSRVLMLLGVPTPLPYQAFGVLTAVGIDVAILLFVATVRLAKGNRTALAVGFVTLLMSPLRYMVTHVYTHTLVYPYLFAALFFYTLASKQQGWKKWAVYLSIGCVLLALAALMAGSAHIVMVALAIQAVLSQKWRKMLLTVGITLLAWLVVRTAFYAVWENSGYVDTSRRNEMLFPVQHWLVLGLSETGTYNEEDFFEMVAQPTYADKVEFLNEKLVRRITEKSAADWANLIQTKTYRSWSGGGYVGQTPAVGQFINKHMPPALYLLMLAAAVQQLRRPRAGLGFLSGLTLLGVFLFVLLYESTDRLAVPYIMLMGLLAVMGAQALLKAGKKGLAMLAKDTGRPSPEGR